MTTYTYTTENIASLTINEIVETLNIKDKEITDLENTNSNQAEEIRALAAENEGLHARIAELEHELGLSQDNSVGRAYLSVARAFKDVFAAYGINV